MCAPNALLLALELNNNSVDECNINLCKVLYMCEARNLTEG